MRFSQPFTALFQAPAKSPASLATVFTESEPKPVMRTMTCKDLGGTCDQRLTAGSWDEMVKTMTKHVMEKHPDVAKQMERMHKDDPKQWGKEMKPKWDASPEA